MSRVMEQSTNLGFRAHAVAAINPDVLRHDLTLLVKLHILQELEKRQL